MNLEGIIILIICVIMIIVLLKFLFGVLMLTPTAYEHDLAYATQLAGTLRPS